MAEERGGGVMETVEQWFKRHGLNTQSEVMDRLESLEAQVDRFKTMSTVEMMCENESVRAHVTEWEARCLKAEAQLAERDHDIQAYRGALGYSVPGDSSDRMINGDFPVNGIAQALHTENAALSKRNRELREGLRVYGVHKANCSWYPGLSDPCTCGFNKLLEAKE
jgi:hypothetical protein